MHERDAESRAAAVRALSSVAQELFPIDAQSRAVLGQDGSEPDANVVLEDSVISPLLEAARDYCTDDRWTASISVNNRSIGMRQAQCNGKLQGPSVMKFAEPGTLCVVHGFRGIFQHSCTDMESVCLPYRGDVGSWVREAAITALAQVLLLWWHHVSWQDAQHRGTLSSPI